MQFNRINTEEKFKEILFPKQLRIIKVDNYSCEIVLNTFIDHTFRLFYMPYEDQFYIFHYCINEYKKVFKQYNIPYIITKDGCLIIEGNLVDWGRHSKLK